MQLYILQQWQLGNCWILYYYIDFLLTVLLLYYKGSKDTIIVEDGLILFIYF